MKRRMLLGAGAAMGLLLAVYVPTFAVVSAIRPSVERAVPMIIGISLALSLAWIALFVNRRIADFAQFGFRWPSARYLAIAVLVGVPLALLVAWLTHAMPSNSPLDTSGFSLWALVLFFGIGSPIQEEVVFRGLLQSFLVLRWIKVLPAANLPVSTAVLFTAFLFGIVHLGSGVAVFVGAIVLGIVAGELRLRSGSLVPAIVVHALFNIPDLIWR